jgi:hypothetical protein
MDESMDWFEVEDLLKEIEDDEIARAQKRPSGPIEAMAWGAGLSLLIALAGAAWILAAPGETPRVGSRPGRVSERAPEPPDLALEPDPDGSGAIIRIRPPGPPPSLNYVRRAAVVSVPAP